MEKIFSRIWKENNTDIILIDGRFKAAIAMDIFGKRWYNYFITWVFY